MYKLKIKKGEVTRIKDDKRTGINIVLKYDGEYSQDTLKRLYDAGFTKLVSKAKPKKQEDESTND